ncbi:MAG TPA: M48 family metalloprotease, partial [Gemmata sp.]|nr:M48 family metalloprotease [Gemmata sp.]
MTGIEEARTYLPWWVVWGPLVVRLPFLFVMSFLVASLAAIVTGWPLRKAKDESWVTRARLAYPVRMASGRINLVMLLIPALILNFFSGQLCPIPNDLLTLLTGITCYSGSAIAFFFAERRIRQGCFTFVGFLRNVLFYWLFFGPSLLVFLCFIPFMPQTFNDTAVVLFFTATGLIVFFSVGGGLFVARILRLAKPAPKRLREIVEKVSVSMGVHVRGSYVVHAPVVQALAWPFLKCVAFTSTALELLDDDEVAAICAHEVAHLSESRLMNAGRIS